MFVGLESEHSIFRKKKWYYFHRESWKSPLKRGYKMTLCFLSYVTVENILWPLWTSNQWFPSISFPMWLLSLSLLPLFSHLCNGWLYQAQVLPLQGSPQVFASLEPQPLRMTQTLQLLSLCCLCSIQQQRLPSARSLNQREKFWKIEKWVGHLMILSLFYHNKDEFFGHSSLEATSLTGNASRVGKSHWAPKILIFHLL